MHLRTSAKTLVGQSQTQSLPAPLSDSEPEHQVADDFPSSQRQLTNPTLPTTSQQPTGHTTSFPPKTQDSDCTIISSNPGPQTRSSPSDPHPPKFIPVPQGSTPTTNVSVDTPPPELLGQHIAHLEAQWLKTCTELSEAAGSADSICAAQDTLEWYRESVRRLQVQEQSLRNDITRLMPRPSDPNLAAIHAGWIAYNESIRAYWAQLSR